MRGGWWSVGGDPVAWRSGGLGSKSTDGGLRSQQAQTGRGDPGSKVSGVCRDVALRYMEHVWSQSRP